MSKDEDFGFAIAGGIDSPLEQNDCSIFVTQVTQEGVAFDKLRLVFSFAVVVFHLCISISQHDGSFEIHP